METPVLLGTQASVTRLYRAYSIVRLAHPFVHFHQKLTRHKAATRASTEQSPTMVGLFA
jgi:hypothetical protein